MRSTRVLLNTSYVLLIIWWLIRWACDYAPLILLPPVFIFFYGAFPAFFIMSVALLFDRKKWISEVTVVVVLLQLPVTWTYIGQPFVAELKHRVQAPSESDIYSFIRSGAGFGIEDEYMGYRSVYNKETKKLELEIHFHSKRLMSEFTEPDSPIDREDYSPERFVTYLRDYYIFPEALSKVTVVPKEIILYGYWDDTLIAENHFTLTNGTYRLSDSSPLRLMVADGLWSLEYTIHHQDHRMDLIQFKKNVFYKETFW